MGIGRALKGKPGQKVGGGGGEKGGGGDNGVRNRRHIGIGGFEAASGIHQLSEMRGWRDVGITVLGLLGINTKPPHISSLITIPDCSSWGLGLPDICRYGCI